MSFEKKVHDAFARRAADVQPSLGARATFERNAERTYRRRTVASSVLGIAILTTLGMAAASLPRALHPEPSLFTSPSSVSTFRFEMIAVTRSERGPQKMIMRGEVDLTEGRSRTTMIDGTLGQQVVTITDGDRVYMEVPALTDRASSLGDARWISAKQEPSFQAIQGMPFLSQDPVAFFDDLNRVARTVEQLSDSRRIRSVQTTGYRAVIDGERLFAPMFDAMEQMMRRMAERFAAMPSMPDSFSGPNENEIEESIRMMRETAPDEVDVVIWIGGDQLPRRFEMKLELPTLGPQRGGTVTMTTDYFDYGAPISIELPPASEVEQVESLMDVFLPSSITSESRSSCAMLAPIGGEPVPCPS